MSTPKDPRQMTPEELEGFQQEPRLLPREPTTIPWKTSTGMEGLIALDDAELKAVADKISAALRSHELNTRTVPVYYEMSIFLREIS